MADIGAFTVKDAELILKAAKAWQSSQGGFISKIGRVSRNGIYAKVLVPIETTEGATDNKKQATAIEVVFDFNTYTFIEVVTDPIRYENDNLDSAGRTVFDTTNISSKSALSENQIVELQHYPNLSETSDWLVVEGGGAERPYVIITSVVDAANYKGDVLGGPDDPTVKETGVNIKVPGATSNDFSVGYTAFSDLVSSVYYLDGFLLGGTIETEEEEAP